MVTVGVSVFACYFQFASLVLELMCSVVQCRSLV